MNSNAKYQKFLKSTELFLIPNQLMPQSNFLPNSYQV